MGYNRQSDNLFLSSLVLMITIELPSSPWITEFGVDFSGGFFVSVPHTNIVSGRRWEIFCCNLLVFGEDKKVLIGKHYNVAHLSI